MYFSRAEVTSGASAMIPRAELPFRILQASLQYFALA